MTRWVHLNFFLLFVVLLCSACTERPTGVTGRVAVPMQAVSPTQTPALQVRILTLIVQEAVAPARVFVEGEVAATAEIGADGTFRVHLRPDNYLLLVVADDQEIERRMIQVKRNRMTRVDIELKSFKSSQESK